MRVLMLGWEFPPFISGGLGTACYGLTKALSGRGVRVTFVLPKAIGAEHRGSQRAGGRALTQADHVKLLAPQSESAAGGDRSPAAVASTYAVASHPAGADAGADTGPQPYPPPSRSTAAIEGWDRPANGGFENVIFKAVPSRMVSPYTAPARTVADASHTTPLKPTDSHPSAAPPADALSSLSSADPGPGNDYAGDLVAEARRYAQLCVDLSRGESFDVVHAHDWLTFPAGVAVAAVSGRPLVVHVHSTEYDRAGANAHRDIVDVERRGVQAADRVIAVSNFTRAVLIERYGVDPNRVEVVHNGIDNGTLPPPANRKSLASAAPGRDRLVLFLGRITMQKGPEYFVEAARKVLGKVRDVKFVMAGAGDKIHEVQQLARQHGIADRMSFTGFLRGPEVDRIYRMADVYVMPSVSEPFGIAPLEAISHDVPVIISKTSGVSEVLRHALKVDFWDTDEIANKIVAVLRHPALAQTLRENAEQEVRKLTWAESASKVVGVYEDVA